MANINNKNPMVADTAGVGVCLVAPSTKVTISSIVVKASNATWAVILKDGEENVIFDASQIAGPITFSPATSFTVTGIKVDTLTNAKAYIYKA